MSGTYTKEMHEAYRKEQDDKAAQVEEERREKMEKECATRTWWPSRRPSPGSSASLMST
jgi:hypothetical protein